MQRIWRPIGAVGILLALALPAAGDVVITEIMYDPASSEANPVRTEWVEIYNTGDDPVDLAGWRLRDEDARTEPLPDGTTIAPRQVIVLVPGGCSASDFHAAWGRRIRVYPLEKWGSGAGSLGLANNPTQTNEILTLRNAADEIIDEVNYQEQSPWPSGEVRGASIYLLPGAIDPNLNDRGGRWRFAAPNIHGGRNARATDLFNADDIGSPGIVATTHHD